jgi:hypothetical protein
MGKIISVRRPKIISALHEAYGNYPTIRLVRLSKTTESSFRIANHLAEILSGHLVSRRLGHCCYTHLFGTDRCKDTDKEERSLIR